MTGDDGDLVRQGEEGGVDGFEELVGISSGEVGAANGAVEESVSGEQKGLLRDIEADASFGMAGGVEDGAG